MENNMKRYLRSTIAALLAIVIIISGYLPIVAVAQPSKYSTSSNSGTRDEVCTSLEGPSADAYYSGNNEYDVLSRKGSSEILNSLKSLMRETHKTITTYNDCKNYVWKTDCENNDTSHATTLYKDYQMTSSDWSPSWSCNREHVWPKSAGGNTTTGGGADLHHIRPAIATVNSARENSPFGYASGQYVPADNVKGDVARICLYVYVRWGSDWGATSITKVFQSVDVLLEWCELDPVDTWEMGRNEVVGAIQGNRNVFIDYPEYAWLIFGRAIPADMVTPSGEAMNQEGKPSNPGTPVVPGDPTCTHSNTVIKNQVEANCKNDGYSGDVHCADCGVRVEYGSQVPSNGVHVYGDWEIADDGNYKKNCNLCDASVLMTETDLYVTVESDAERILLLLLLGSTDSILLDTLSK